MNKFGWTNTIAVIVMLVVACWYGYYTWSDCLEENSFFTCSRMLNK